MLLLTILIAAAGLASGVWGFCFSRGDWLHRTIIGLLPISAAAAIVMLLVGMLNLASAEWSEAKLAPVVALTRGYRLYQDPVNGVMTAWIYGPVGAIVLLPATLGRDPMTVAMIGAVINSGVYFASVIWLLTRASRGGAGIVLATALALFAWESVSFRDLSRCVFVPGPDGPALALATCACAAIYIRRSNLNMLFSSLAAVLCIWTKQNLLPIGFVLIAYIAIADGWKTCTIYVGMFAGVGAVISSVLILSFGPSNMWFHMILLPASHPMRDGPAGLPWMWYIALRDLLLADAGNLVLLGMMLALNKIVRSSGEAEPSNLTTPEMDRSTWRGWFAARPWSLLLLVALASPLFALPGYMKIGGYVNNLGLSNFFVLLTGLTCALETRAIMRDRLITTPLAVITPCILLMGGLVIGTYSILDPEYGIAALAGVINHPYQNRQRTLFQFCCAHREEVYCPWNPLTTLLADDKFYHFEWGFLDRKYARNLPPPESFERNLPANLKYIIYLREPQSAAIQTMFNGFDRRVELPELPDCLVYADAPTAH